MQAGASLEQMRVVFEGRRDDARLVSGFEMVTFPYVTCTAASGFVVLHVPGRVAQGCVPDDVVSGGVESSVVIANQYSIASSITISGVGQDIVVVTCDNQLYPAIIIVGDVADDVVVSTAFKPDCIVNVVLDYVVVRTTRWAKGWEALDRT